MEDCRLFALEGAAKRPEDQLFEVLGADAKMVEAVWSATFRYMLRLALLFCRLSGNSSRLIICWWWVEIEKSGRK